MITIQTSQIKKFISASEGVSDSKMLPIYGYVKLVCRKDGSYLIKHNGHRFVVFDVDASFKEEQTIMIETKPLFGFVKFSRTENIMISPNGMNVKINDGERSISCQITKDLYPSIPDHSKINKFELSTEVIESLAIAKTHSLASSDNSMRPWTCFVHVRKIGDKFFVIGTRGEVTYFKGFKEDLTEMSLEPEVISTIQSNKQLSYCSVENFDYFETIGILYGFIKPETRCSDMVDKVLQNFESPNSFEVNTRPILDFCEMVTLVNDSSVPAQIKIEGKGKTKNGNIVLRFSDISDNVNAQESIPVQNKTFEFNQCFFLPRNLITVLKGAKKDRVKISYAHSNFIVTSSEEDYIGAIMELAPIKPIT